MLKRLFLHYIAEEARPMLRLAIPLVLAELGWMTMAIVDTMMVGRQANSAVAIGAVSLGSILFNAAAIFRHGIDARARYACFALLRRGRCGRLPPLAGERCVLESWDHADS